MFIELVDVLRCVEPHEDSWLVLASRRMVGRSVVDGTLGCPVCRRSYPIAGGVAYLGATPDDAQTRTPARTPAHDAPTEEDAMRLAALLGLTAPNAVVALAGPWARHADALLAMVPLRLLLLDPDGDDAAAGRAASSDDGSVSVVRTRGDAVPLAAGVLHAVAVDGAARLDGAARALAAGGRIVAPADAPLPAGVRELARDAAVWVGERERTGGGASAPVPLSRARRG